MNVHVRDGLSIGKAVVKALIILIGEKLFVQVTACIASREVVRLYSAASKIEVIYRFEMISV